MPEGLDVKPPTARVCEGEGEEGGWGSCDPTAPRPASQAGETQAHVGAPLTRHELVEASPRGALMDIVAGCNPSESAAAFVVTVTFLDR